MKLFLTTVAILSVGCLGNPTPRLIGGDEDTEQNYAKYVVSLQLNEAHKCAATILNENWVLTAATCLYDNGVLIADKATLRVKQGSLKHGSGGQDYQVSDYKVHGSFKYEAYWDFDIAVVKISTTFPADAARVTLPNTDIADPANGALGAVSGWGSTCSTCGLSVNMKIIDDLNIYSKDECNKAFTGVTEITDNMICAGSLSAFEGVCAGDGGDPLLVDGLQIGIASWMKRPCISTPGVFTKVKNFKAWIEENIEAEVTP